MPQDPNYIDSGGRRVADDINTARGVAGLVGDIAGLGWDAARGGARNLARGIVGLPSTVRRGARSAYRATASGIRHLPETLKNAGTGLIEAGMVPIRGAGQRMVDTFGQQGANAMSLDALEMLTQNPMARGLTADWRNPMPLGMSADDTAAILHRDLLVDYINRMVAGNRFTRSTVDQLDRHLNAAKSYGFNPAFISDLEDYIASKGKKGSINDITKKYYGSDNGDYYSGNYKFTPSTWRTGTSRPAKINEPGYVSQYVALDQMDEEGNRIRPAVTQSAPMQGTTVAPWNSADTVLGALPLIRMFGMAGDAGAQSKNKYIRGVSNVVTAAPVRKAAGNLVQSVKKSAVSSVKKLGRL